MESATSQGRSNEGAQAGASAIRYPYLRDACQQFLVDALQLLGPRAPASAEPSEKGRRAALYGWVEASREQLIALASAAPAASAVAKARLNIGKVSDKDGRELPVEEYAPWHVFHIVLGPLVGEYVAGNRGRLLYDPRVYGRVYARLEEGYSVGPLVRFVAPLENFETERSRLRVEAGLWIERLRRPDVERLAFWTASPPQSLLKGFGEVAMWGMVMVHRSHGFAPFSGYEAKFKALSTALRLARPERVGYRFVVHYPARSAFQSLLSEGGRWNMRPGLPHGPAYVLRRADEARLRSAFRGLSGGSALAAHAIAFSRFDDAYWRDKAEDALIDVWIALESLFMPDADPREATYRLALRIAYFLGRTSQERLAIDKEIRDSYKLRSDVVHGRSYSGSDLRSVTEKTTGYLRRALGTLVRQRAELDVSSIDQAVRAGRKPQETK